MTRWINLLTLALMLQGRRKLAAGRDLALLGGATFLLTSALLLGQALVRETEDLFRHGPDIIVQQRAGGRQEPISLNLSHQLVRLPGIQSVTPRVWGSYRDPLSGSLMTLWGADDYPAAVASLQPDGIPIGSAAISCVVGDGVAPSRHLEPGDLLPVLGAQEQLSVLRITGVFSPETQLLTRDLVLLHSADVRRIFDLPAHTATDLSLTVTETATRGHVAREIRQHFPTLLPIPQETVRSLYRTLFSGGSWFVLPAWILYGATLVLLCWNRATCLPDDDPSVADLCRAMGWTRPDILALKLLEGLVVALPAYLTGLLAALLTFPAAPWLELLGALSRTPDLAFDLHLVPQLTPDSWLLPLLLTLFPYSAAGLLPAWRTLRRPEETAGRVVM